MSRECPTRYEQPDPTPLAEAVLPARPRPLRELVAEYMQSHLVQDYVDEEEFDDWDDVDPDEQVMTDSQLIDLAASEGYFDEDDVDELVEAPSEGTDSVPMTASDDDSDVSEATPPA